MANFTDADTATLLSQPGYFYYRDYNTSDAWNKAVFANGSAFAPTVESVEINFDDVGNVRDEVSNETAEITISSGRVLDLDFINDITGGLYTKTTVPGTPVPGATQTVLSGAWIYDQPMLLEGQNGDGSKPTVNSVTGSVDGVLVEDTDYFITSLPGAGWSIVVIDSATVTTEVQDMDFDYDYTPAAQTSLKRGGVKIITPIEIAFQTTDENGDFVQYFFYKCVSNGADGHGFSPELSAEPVTMDLAFTAKKDTNRASGDQMMEIRVGDVSLG